MYAMTVCVLMGVQFPQENQNSAKFKDFPVNPQEAETWLFKKLQQESLWSDPEGEVFLLECLTLAANIRAKSVAPIMAHNIQHIDTRFRRFNTRVMPCYYGLKVIGLDAVEPILAEIESFDATGPPIPGKTPEDMLKNARALADRADRVHKQRLLVYCLIEIYDVGGHGKVLARQRIHLQAEKATGQKQERLMEALKLEAFH